MSSRDVRILARWVEDRMGGDGYREYPCEDRPVVFHSPFFSPSPPSVNSHLSLFVSLV